MTRTLGHFSCLAEQVSICKQKEKNEEGESILEAIFKTRFSSHGHGVLARLVIKFPLYIVCYVSCFAWVSSTPHNFSEVDNIISERNQENKSIEKSFPRLSLVGES